MLIDVIIPSFNRAYCLSRAVSSVLNQGHSEFKLYVVNDGSTDDTDQVMESFLKDSRVHYLKQENRGVSSARNLGIKNSQSDWVAFLDSDDEWLPNKLELQVRAVRKNPGLRFFHSNEIWKRHNVRINPRQKFDKSSVELFKRSLETCLISSSTVLMQRKLLQVHGNFDEEFLICEDYDLWLKILSTTEVGFLPDHLIIKHGGHPDQLSAVSPTMDYWRIKSLFNLLKKIKLSAAQKSLVTDEIKKKTPILLQGLNKLQNHNAALEIKKIFEEISTT